MNLPHLAQRLFNTPLALHPSKAEVIMASVMDRFGISKIESSLAMEDDWYGYDDTVGVYIMCDRNDNGGFPVGTDGISQLEDWGAVKATGDQLAVADHIYPQQTDTAIVFVCSPIKKVINIEISGIKNADSTTVQGIKDALTALFFDEANPDGSGKVYLSDINGSIGGVSGTTGYILNSPMANITFAVGEIPVLGGVNFV